MKTGNPERGFQKKKNNERFSLVRKHKAKLECLKKNKQTKSHILSPNMVTQQENKSRGILLSGRCLAKYAKTNSLK